MSKRMWEELQATRNERDALRQLRDDAVAEREEWRAKFIKERDDHDEDGRALVRLVRGLLDWRKESEYDAARPNASAQAVVDRINAILRGLRVPGDRL